MSTYYTVDFLAVWEQVNNPNFNRMGFHTVRNGEGRLFLTPKRWVEMTNAIGLFSKSGRYGGGIFAHKDIFNPSKSISARKDKAIKRRSNYANEIFARQSECEVVKGLK